MWRPLVLMLLASLGCEATLPNDTFACDPGEPCPVGFECVAGFCTRNGVGDPDSSIDAALDSSLDSSIDAAFDSAALDAFDPDTPDANCGCDATSVCVEGSCCRALAMIAGTNETICALADDEIYCWGDNTHQQIGPGDGRVAPAMQIDGFTPGSTVDSGGDTEHSHTCAISDEGSLYCWGSNERGQLGIGTNMDQEHPTAVIGAGWTHVSTADQHTCGIRSGVLLCWGDAYEGKLGVEPPLLPLSAAPVMVTNDSDWEELDCEGGTCCAIRAGQLYCWGRNAQGQVGNETESDQMVPVAIELDAIPQDVACGREHCCVLTTLGSVFCWGANHRLQLGISTPQNAPFRPVPISATAITAGKLHTCAISDGDVWCWGANNQGQLGTMSSLDAAPASTGLAATSVAAGRSHTCAITEGALHCWGVEPGTDATTNVPRPLCLPVAL